MRLTSLIEKIRATVTRPLMIVLIIVCGGLFALGWMKPVDAKSRALFVSVIEDPVVLSNREEIKKLIRFAKRTHIKILFVQVYRSNQSWFFSKVADDTMYQKSLKSVGEDPLALLIRDAHREGIQVHAWLNLMSLGVNKNAYFIKKYGPEILTRNFSIKNTIEDYKIDQQFFLEPGDPRVRKDLGTIVSELVLSYAQLDGIQFDYIRYPDFKPFYGHSRVNLERFQRASGVAAIHEKDPLWRDWKRKQVTETLRYLVNIVRGLRAGIQISTTGCMPYPRAYDEAFQDWAEWIRTGVVDFVTIMNYSPDPGEYRRWIEAVKSKDMDWKKVKIGVGVYKFVKSPEMFAQEMKICQEYSQSCAIFYYGIFNSNPQLEALIK